jgi:hypothetical protein
MARSIADLLSDRELLEPMLMRLVEEAGEHVAKQSEESGFAAVYTQALSILAPRHCRLVFEHAGSPIERVWMNSLQIQFLRDADMLVTTPPIADVVAWRTDMVKAITHAQVRIDAWNKTGRPITALKDYLDDEVQGGRMSPEYADTQYFWLMEYGVLPFRHAYHLTLQAGFPKRNGRGHGMRVDALIWHPDDPSLSFIVECDGYQYHSNQDSFTADRQRDRILHREGHTVFRFSGSEIMRDPALAIRDLYDLLRKRAPGG